MVAEVGCCKLKRVEGARIQRMQVRCDLSISSHGSTQRVRASRGGPEFIAGTRAAAAANAANATVSFGEASSPQKSLPPLSRQSGGGLPPGPGARPLMSRQSPATRRINHDVVPASQQPGQGPYVENSVASRSVAVQAAPTPWRRFYLPKVWRCRLTPC